MKNIKLYMMIISLLTKKVISWPVLAGVCIGACYAGVVACYAALGYVFGTVTAGIGTPAGILACNAAQGVCMTGCAAVGVLPTP